MNQRDNEICWYHANITREQGDQLLLSDHRQLNGLFLVRDSVSSPHDYVLSVLYENQVNNYQIRRHQEDAFFSISQNEYINFHGLESLVDYYRKQPLEDGLVLSECVKGREPPHQTRRSGSSNLLHRATDIGNFAIVSELLKSGYPGYDAKNPDGKTAAHLAAHNGDNEILQQLIMCPVNTNLRDALGVTPLHYAAECNHPDTVRLLITSGKANVQARSTENGEVPLHVAASNGHLRVIKVLLELGAPVNPRTTQNLTPAELARMNNHLECAEYLESYKTPRPRISQNQFYHGTMDRHAAEDKIRHYGPESGVYLIRYSDRNEVYILSLFHEKVCNYIIKKEIKFENQYMVIDDGPLLNSLEHLVDYYSTLPDGLPTVLTAPVPPAPKPAAPPISTLPQDDIPVPNVFQNIAFTHELSFINNNNYMEPEENVISPNMVVCGRLIGEGEFAAVYEGKLYNENGNFKSVAIKTLRNEQLESNIENFRREAKMMYNLNHHCVVKLLGICLEPQLQMIQELVPLGSILNYIDNNAQDINPDFEFKIWAAQIACGMNYLEENRFVHRDLAARNILLSSKYQAKISDFGLSRALDLDHEYYRALQGGRWPLKWYAPESFNFGEFDHKSDVWSFGVTIWEIYSFGENPWGDLKGADAIILIEKGERLQRPDACPITVYDKMLECWAFHKSDRPTFNDLANYFQQESEYINLRELIPEADLA